MSTTGLRGVCICGGLVKHNYDYGLCGLREDDEVYGDRFSASVEEVLRFAHHTENEIPRMRAWRIKTQLSLKQCLRILDVSVENNIPCVFEPTPAEIHLPFFVRYINWTLDKVQSPPQQ
uniref:Uncharacterized protein n=1 Tax=Lactuca sativa TaxID=4236 RepID=A0A9R1WRR3_LACSA|nr:hypothetical protein LSAT_V11C900472770 [Lactuca sativa]